MAAGFSAVAAEAIHVISVFSWSSLYQEIEVVLGGLRSVRFTVPCALPDHVSFVSRGSCDPRRFCSVCIFRHSRFLPRHTNTLVLLGILLLVSSRVCIVLVYPVPVRKSP